MSELAFVDAVVVEMERTVETEDRVEKGKRTPLELEPEPEPVVEVELAAAVERELTALRRIVAIMVGTGVTAKISLELLQQARLPGPRPWVSQLGEGVSIFYTLVYRLRRTIGY